MLWTFICFVSLELCVVKNMKYMCGSGQLLGKGGVGAVREESYSLIFVGGA